MNASKALVLGASGFLGSHLVRNLVGRGQDVRTFTRRSSNCSVTAGLPVERVFGEIDDTASLESAMRGVDTVYHCIVNAKAWLRDPGPLYEVNVEGLKRALGIARNANVRRYVLTSSYATIAPRKDGLSTEADIFTDTSRLPAYIRCRIDAERAFFDFTNNSGMEAVACCVASTYGANDIGPTPQGQLIRDVSTGRLPFYWEGGACSLGIEDAAEGMRLAGENGRSGERYIFSERWISYRELFEATCQFSGRRPRLVAFPKPLMMGSARITEWFARLLGIENKFNVDAIRCSNELGLCSNDKARVELGWHPRPVLDAVREAVDYFNARRSGQVLTQ